MFILVILFIFLFVSNFMQHSYMEAKAAKIWLCSYVTHIRFDSLNSANPFFLPHPIQATSVSSPRSDPYHMSCNENSVWTAMSHFIWFLRHWNARHRNSAPEEVGPGKIHVYFCKSCVWRPSLQGRRHFILVSHGGHIEIVMWTVQQKKSQQKIGRPAVLAV